MGSKFVGVGVADVHSIRGVVEFSPFPSIVASQPPTSPPPHTPRVSRGGCKKVESDRTSGTSGTYLLTNIGLDFVSSPSVIPSQGNKSPRNPPE